MFTAKEANERTYTLNTRAVKREKKKVEKKITAAVNKGKRDCWLGFLISDTTNEWLKSLGYMTQTSYSAGYPDDTQVMWW